MASTGCTIYQYSEFRYNNKERLYSAVNYLRSVHYYSGALEVSKVEKEKKFKTAAAGSRNDWLIDLAETTMRL